MTLHIIVCGCALTTYDKKIVIKMYENAAIVALMTYCVHMLSWYNTTSTPERCMIHEERESFAKNKK